MTSPLPPDRTRELVASFAEPAAFKQAVEALLAAGFDRTDLSMLGTHDSLEVAGDLAGYRREPVAAIRAGLADEAGLVGSIALAGILLLVAGPVGVAGAAVAAAAAGALALRPFFAQFTEAAHVEGLARAIEEGSILLWVRTGDVASVERAEQVLSGFGVPIARLAAPVREALQ
jgi:hypothetical protein